ncbi:MAG: multicopper oxidase family protein [Alteromonadaceae bacterium]|nr:multicopper oxidase family protein [Alteromonadaceae bacterium]
MKKYSLMKFPAVLLTLVMTVSACHTDLDKANTTTDNPPVPARNINGPILEDINTDPTIVEVMLEAKVSEIEYRQGVSSTIWSYNGIVPGPVINANVGDTLIVNFTNNLPEETTVHWHGIELPANMDGSMISQKPVLPGESFKYEFKLLRASTFWYHPHTRGNEQIELGLQGLLVVHDPAEDESLALPTQEHHWVLDDVLLDDNGKLVEVGFPTDPVENAITQANGREGNTLLVNGQVAPTMEWAIGEPQRIRVVNSANTRFMRLSIPGHTLYRIGGDAGLLTAPMTKMAINPVKIHTHSTMGTNGCTETSSDDYLTISMSDPDLEKGIFLTPGERADFIVVPHGEDGDTLNIQWHDYSRGRHIGCTNNENMVVLGHSLNDGHLKPQTLLNITLSTDSDANVDPDYQPPSSLRTITPIDVTDAEIIPVTFGHMQPDSNGDINFFVAKMNGMGMAFKDITPMMAPRVNANDTRIIEVKNMAMGDHNFHIHGFMFQLIETEYVDLEMAKNNYTVPAPILEEKDTIHLPRRPGMMMGKSWSITRLAIRFSDEGREGQILASGKMPTDTTSGGWLFHCHILDHGARGMANFLQIF